MKRCFVLLLTSLMFFCAFSGTQSDIETVKQRVLKEALKGEVNNEQVEKLLKSIKSDGTWPGIDYGNVSREGFEHRFHLEHMLTLAKAYKTSASNKGSLEVLQALELALLNWVENDYFCDNWWHNQIGTPNALVTLMLVAGEDIDEELVQKAQPIIGRAHTEAGGARPGGDRIKIAGIQAKNCLFLNNDKKFDEIIRIIESEIKYVDWIGADFGYGYRNIKGGFDNRSEEGRGIQYDNSFHHRTDGVNNTLSYGYSYAHAFIEWAHYTRGTNFSFSNEKLSQLTDYYLDGICKSAVFGKYPDVGAKNRSFSRKGTLDPYSSVYAKKLLECTDYREKEVKEIIDIRDKGAKPTLSHSTYFWNSEHFSIQRPDWFTSVRMYSTRNYNMEQPYNSEGFLNHHRGDGASHISIRGDEYYDIAPVYDYQKIPGTTVLQKPEIPSGKELQKLGLTDFVGAATDGVYGAVAFDFKSPHDPLIARKSWFFFDEEYVCLGAGISCRINGLPVVTTINQCLLGDELIVSTQNGQSEIEMGEHLIENVNWVYHDRVGYVFPKTETVHLKNESIKGSWYRVNRQTDSPRDELSKEVFKLWVDHGQRPSNESYAYIVVPATSLAEMEKKSSQLNVEILANSPYVQAVKNEDKGMCQLVFYKNGELQITDDLLLSCEHPGIVMIKFDGEKITEITVADPNRELSKFYLSITTKLIGEGDNFKTDWNETKKVSEITIDLPQNNYAGKSVTVKL